jgi:enoyl-CoA hydratase
MTESETPAGGHIQTSVEHGIGWIVIDNQLRRNAISGEMFSAIVDAVAAFEADEEVRVIILRGAGSLAFSAGADLKEVGAPDRSPEDVQAFEEAFAGSLRAVERCAKPTMAMIQGFWIGGGAALAMCCDIRIAADDSRFAVTPAKIGLAFDYEGTKRLVDLAGPAFAKEILMTARQFPAEECAVMGLVNKVVRKADLEMAVTDYARKITANAPLAVRAAKLAVNAAMRDLAGKDVSEVDEAVGAARDSEDAEEARRAIQEKRPPRFTGR